MQVWPFHRHKPFPSYSLLKAQACRLLPVDLYQRERSEDFEGCVERIRLDLLATSPFEEMPDFVVFLKAKEKLLHLDRAEGRGLAIFTSKMRAADYANSQAPELVNKLEFWPCSPHGAAELIKVFRQDTDIRFVALNACPRCNTFARIDPAIADSPAGLINSCASPVSRLIGRSDLYRDYARSAARAGLLEKARDVALELVGHVTAADARVHFLLAKLGMRLKDRRLQREATAFLEFIGDSGAVQELKSLKRTDDWQF